MRFRRLGLAAALSLVLLATANPVPARAQTCQTVPPSSNDTSCANTAWVTRAIGSIPVLPTGLAAILAAAGTAPQTAQGPWTFNSTVGNFTTGGTVSVGSLAPQSQIMPSIALSLWTSLANGGGIAFNRGTTSSQDNFDLACERRANYSTSGATSPNGNVCLYIEDIIGANVPAAFSEWAADFRIDNGATATPNTFPNMAVHTRAIHESGAGQTESLNVVIQDNQANPTVAVQAEEVDFIPTGTDNGANRGGMLVACCGGANNITKLFDANVSVNGIANYGYRASGLGKITNAFAAIGTHDIGLLINGTINLNAIDLHSANTSNDLIWLQDNIGVRWSSDGLIRSRWNTNTSCLYEALWASANNTASLIACPQTAATVNTDQAQASGGTTLLAFASTAGIGTGQVAQATNIPSGDQVSSIVATAQVTQNANGSFSGSQAVIPMNPTASFGVGQQCTDNTLSTVIPAGDVILSIQSNVSITMTSNVNASSGTTDSITCDPVVTLTTATTAAIAAGSAINFWPNRTTLSTVATLSTKGDASVFGNLNVGGTTRIAGSVVSGMAFQAPNAVAINGGTITGLGSPANPTDAVNKNYVDTQILAQVLWHTPVSFAAAAVLPNAPTYNNGASGVGATLTDTSTGSVLVVDGQNVTVLGTRVLVPLQASALQNGIYSLTTAGVAGVTPWVLTRTTDFNTAAAGNIALGAAVLVTPGGTTNVSGTAFFMNQTAAITVGVTAITWAQNAAAGNNTTATLPIKIAAANVSFQNIPATSVPANTTGGSATPSGSIAYGTTGANTLLETNGSGLIAAGVLPNPSASTLGGVQSLVAVTSKWINTISTSGVPSATQPAFTDISGAATFAQLPAATGPVIVGRITNTSGVLSAAYTPSNGTDTKVPLVHGATAANQCAQFNDTGGTLVSTGTTCAPTVLSASTPAYFVATTGSDSNPGTLGQPFLTPAKCVTVANSSPYIKTCYLRAGTYAVASGTPISPTAGITIAGYPGDGALAATIDASAMTGSGNSAIVCFTSAAVCTNQTVANLVLKCTPLDQRCVFFGPVIGLNILGNQFNNVNCSAVKQLLTIVDDNNTHIQGNQFNGCPSAVTDSVSAGIDDNVAHSGFWFTDNIVDGCDRFCVERVITAGTSSTLDNEHFDRNTFSRYSPTAICAGGGIALSWGGGFTPSNTMVTQGTMWGNRFENTVGPDNNCAWSVELSVNNVSAEQNYTSYPSPFFIVGGAATGTGTEIENNYALIGTSNTKNGIGNDFLFGQDGGYVGSSAPWIGVNYAGTTFGTWTAYTSCPTNGNGTAASNYCNLSSYSGSSGGQPTIHTPSVPFQLLLQP